LRILRLTRILRILKVNRYSKSLDLIGHVVNKKKYELLVTMFITSILLLLASSVMYYIENVSQPESFPNIIAAFWWAVATLTTVGYGDVYPITVWGKFISGIIALLGIGLVALPTGIISAGFLEIIEESKSDKKCNYCSNCGHKL
jgi:voltage-gated potassium channel